MSTTLQTTRRSAALLLFVVLGCASTTPPATTATTAKDATDEALDRVAVIHGGAGPWVVAGYRMGRYALAKLTLAPQSFDIEVVHHTPSKVQYSCIADGAAASTGASAGKLNLKLVDASDAEVMTTYRKKSTGESITLRPSAAFVARFRDIPLAELKTAGRVVMTLPDAEIFEEVPASR